MPQHASELRVDGDRLWASLMEMARIGATAKGGCRRIAFSAEDDAARALFKSWCVEAGLDVVFDRFGNMFARRAGREDGAPVVLGSHLDTQPTGGRFDGILGVLAALEAVRCLNDAAVTTRRPLVIANWTNEEGAIIRPMIGSETFTGALPLAEALALTDDAGTSISELLAGMQNGAGPLEVGFPIHRYLELHIEQGPILENEGGQIGIVTGGIGFRRYVFNFQGQEAHAGPTPMESRKDAMVAAARAVLMADTAARGKPGARATIGQLHTRSGSPNTVAADVEMTLDLRHGDNAVLDALEQEVLSGIARMASDQGVSVSWREVANSSAVPFDAEVIAVVADAAGALGYRSSRMLSGAGHDACHIARKYPAGMIFVPSANGLSHNEAEYTAPDDCRAGADVLLRAALHFAEPVGPA
ncbi:hypothetical protein AS156_31885 [Bradyrhizobium macuxiense]|uniref:Zn-dependent hydrolase n=1 Tax=Bradyrhizobium macuxiense TaxID=1755647 RepID=A0A125QA35_9BRAD|nr:Zn-dependent hydrolase [Bradyrhizobium macuxiense]KWV59272.1 hypothetical protein AS156_31885 [Bradyrhizobium macuxiense]